MTAAENIRPVREGFQQDPPQQEKQPRAAPPPHMEESPAAADPAGSTAAASPEPFKEQWPIVVRLIHKKIPNNEGEIIDRLSFRQPRGGDINRYGNPCRVNQDAIVVIDDCKILPTSWRRSVVCCRRCWIPGAGSADLLQVPIGYAIIFSQICGPGCSQ